MAKKIDLDTAGRLIEAAKKKAKEIKVAMNIAVVDEGNNLVAFQRMNGAWLGSINISMNKAYTARAFDMETKTLMPLCQPGQPLYGIHASNDGRLIIFPGGIPLKDGDTVIDPIGDARSRYTVRFYVIAMFFIVFDIEAIFLYPWAVVFKPLGWFGFVEMLVFISIIAVGLVYVWGKGALEWE